MVNYKGTRVRKYFTFRIFWHISRNLLLIVLTIITSCAKDKSSSNTDPVELVNPLMGTDSEYILSNGNTYPAIAMPWGMNFWTPQTRNMGNGWTYAYRDNKILGIKQTHQPSPWINDYAAF